MLGLCFAQAARSTSTSHMAVSVRPLTLSHPARKNRSHTLSCFRICRRTRVSFEKPWKIFTALPSSEKYMRDCVGHGGPRWVRTLQDKAERLMADDWPPLRGDDGHLSFTWYCWQGGASFFRIIRRTRLCYVQLLKILVALVRQRNTCELCQRWTGLVAATGHILRGCDGHLSSTSFC